MTKQTRTEEYRGWTISLRAHEQYCSKFASTLTAPDGREKHINAAGDNESAAMARSREVVDMEQDHFN